MNGILTDRAVILVQPKEAGEDVGAFLQGLVTNDVMQASEHRPIYAALLTAQGKMAFDFFIWAKQAENGTAFLFDCEKEAASDLVKRLSLYRLRRAINIAVDETAQVHWEKQDGGNDPRLPGLGQRSVVSNAPDTKPADAEYLAHRLSLGVPEGRAEMGDILWLETNAVELNGVSFTKGCYVGQENTARMNWRQKINRRLVVVPLEASQEKRRKASYAELNLAIDHLRVSDIPDNLVPDWRVLNADEGEQAASD